MKTIDDLNSRLQQVSIKVISDEKLKVSVKQNSFTAGFVNLPDRTFYNVQRTSKNLFKLFGGGLGLNSELLNIVFPHFNIHRIIIPYEDIKLETIVDKWRRLGIVSPYGDARVDKQIVLALSEINMKDVEKYRQVIKQKAQSLQLSLFAGG
jgi:hypothetical protein